MTQAVVFSIQRFSTEDGPGIRTTVFFKGCPMRCPWCHNPEGIRPKPHLVWTRTRCIGCFTCKEVCENQGLIHRPDKIEVDRAACKTCGACEEECPGGALEVVGKRYTPKELADEVLKDQAFYETSEGGLTCSGGEPMVYMPFLEEFLPIVKKAGVHITLDTCGSALPKAYDRILPFVDLVLLDIKTMDSDKHMEYTAIPLDRVLNAARHFAKKKIPMWIRTPLIPGYTDDERNVAAVAKLIRTELPNVERYDLLAFSNLCTSKYDQLSMKWALEKRELLTKKDLERFKKIAENEDVQNVVASGPTKVGNG